MRSVGWSNLFLSVNRRNTFSPMLGPMLALVVCGGVVLPTVLPFSLTLSLPFALSAAYARRPSPRQPSQAASKAVTADLNTINTPAKAHIFWESQAPGNPLTQPLTQTASDAASSAAQALTTLNNNPPLPEWTQTFPQTAWWTAFNDPTLEQLMTLAFEQNPSLAALNSRIVQASAMAKINSSVLYPQVDLGGSYLMQQYAKDQFVFPLSGRTFHSAQTPLTMAYELDLWGKNRDNVAISKLGIDTARYAYASGRTQLASQLAFTYFQLTKWQALQQAQQQMVAISQKNLFHTERLHQYKQVSASQVALARQYVEQSQSELATLNGWIGISQQQINTFLGRSATSGATVQPTPLERIDLPTTLQSGVPASLIEHRPDVAAQEAALLAARLNITVAKKSLLPTLKINAGTGFAAVGGWNKLFDVSNISSFLMPSISQPILRGGVLKNGIIFRKAEYEQMLQQYRQTVLTAFQEAENGLTQWQSAYRQWQDNQQAYQAMAEQAYHAQQQYQQGQTGQPAWLLAESQRLTGEKALINQKAQVLMETVNVYKALGGGFERIAAVPSTVKPTSTQLNQQVNQQLNQGHLLP
jgi:NodT family efflux transporter outer membrane factor (OMF) lipoprotein